MTGILLARILKNIRKNLILLPIIALYGSVATAASVAYYIPENAFVDWAQPTKDPNIYKIYISHEEKRESRLVHRDTLSFRARAPVDGVYFGWVLYLNSTTNSFEHCQVLDLFENRRINVFCDLPGRGRIQYSGLTRHFIGEVATLGEFGKGHRAILNQDYQGYKKGQLVEIKALFAGSTDAEGVGKALVLAVSVENLFMKGPYYNSISKVIDVTLLNVTP